MSEFLAPFFSTGEFFEASERAVIEVIRRRSHVQDEVVLLAVGLVVWAHRRGDPCVDLRNLNNLNVEIPGLTLPKLTEFVDHLHNSPEVVRVLSGSEIGDVQSALEDARPLVLVNSLLFSQRQFTDELTIAHQLLRRSTLRVDSSKDTSVVDELLPIPDNEDVLAQACGDDGISNRVGKSFLQRKLTVLTGGPGTGKTHTLTRCLAALLSSRSDENVRVALIAPTGKAATRAKELINQFVNDQSSSTRPGLSLSPAVLDALRRIEPKTIQKVLGSKSGQQTRFLHNSKNTLADEIVVVDEMSMVPSYLMARLLEAIDENSTILLVGDQAQLESVESGSVLREIVELSATNDSVLKDSVFELKRVWRQAGETKIGDLARLIRSGESKAALELATSNPAGVEFVDRVRGQALSIDIVEGIVSQLVLARDFAISTSHEDHKRAIDIISQNKVLCGPREGETGVRYWNQVIQLAVHGVEDSDIFRPGTPLLVTVNSPRARLVNGDIGIVVNWLSPDEHVEPMVFFPSAEGGRYLSVAELPPIEVCFSMTIHKSQGSEYSNLVVFLPSLNSPLLTRELIYTAITRAKKTVKIAGAQQAFLQAIDTVSVRSAGISSLMTLLSVQN